MRGQSIKYKEEWMTPGEFEMACGLTGKSKYLDNIQTDYGPLKTLTASGLLKPHSRKCRCSICRGEYESPEKIAKRKRQRELQDQAEAMENSRLNDMGDGINDLDREDNDGDDNFLMVNSHSFFFVDSDCFSSPLVAFSPALPLGSFPLSSSKSYGSLPEPFEFFPLEPLA